MLSTRQFVYKKGGLYAFNLGKRGPQNHFYYCGGQSCRILSAYLYS